MNQDPHTPDPAPDSSLRGNSADGFPETQVCAVCDSPLVMTRLGRPRRYCGLRCKEAAKKWAAVELVIERARAVGDVVLADERQAWLDRARADARDGWAGARARVADVNARVRRFR